MMKAVSAYRPYYPPVSVMEKAREKGDFIVVYRAAYDNDPIVAFETFLWKKGIAMQNCWGYFPTGGDQAAEMIYEFKLADKDKIESYPDPRVRIYL